MTSYVVYYQIISGDNIIINPKYKIDMIACVINMILIAVSLLLLFLLRKKKYKGVKKIIILTAYSGGYPFSISGDIRSVPS